MAKRQWLDTHIHISATNPDGSARADMVGELMKVLDTEDAALSFVINPDGAEMSRVAREEGGALAGARLIQGLIEQAPPGRLYGACMVNPNRFDEALATMDLCFGEYGFRLFGEMLQYMMDYKMSSDPVERLVRRAVQFDVPVQVHISTAFPFKDKSSWGMEQLEDMCGLVDRVPEARYILAHLVGEHDDNPPVVDQYLDYLDNAYGGMPDNFWVEIRDFDSPGVRTVLQRVRPDRLIAGTDWTTRVGPPFMPYGTIFGVKDPADNPYVPRVGTMVDFLKGYGADEETIHLIGYENARQLLKL